MKKGRIIAIAVSVLAVAGGVTFAMWPATVVIDTATIDRGPLRVSLDEDARTRMRARALITSPVAGNLVLAGLRAGDRVTEGQVLARVEPATAPLLDSIARAELGAAVRAAEAAVEQSKAQVARAEAGLDAARAQVERQQKLFASQSVPRIAVDDAQALAHAAEHDVDTARFAGRVAAEQLALQRATWKRGLGASTPGMALLELRSPLQGVVLQVAREHDGVVGPGEPLLEVGDPSSLEVLAPVLTADAMGITPGTPVIIKGWGSGEVEGHVRGVEPKAFTRISALGVEEQRTQVVIDVDVPPAAAGSTVAPAHLGDGWTVQASILQWRSDDVVRAPAGALFRRVDGWGVFVVDGGRARERPVEPGHRDNTGTVEVVKGLAAGDVVILYPADRVVDGTRVVTRSTAPSGG